MKQGLNIILIVLITAVFAGADFSRDLYAAGKPQTLCPVMGGEIDKSKYVDYKGNRIYFCCDSCPEDFKKNPEKYLKKMKAEGIILEKTPAR